jgi:hypothetical protein
MLPDFPHFAPLTLEDKDAYNQLVEDYPPFSNISFTSLHIWWNLEGKLAMSYLNNNLVIYYHVSYDTKNTGYSLIGRHDLDKSIDTLFSYLRGRQEPVRLVHVPEFVKQKIAHQQNYIIEEEPDYNEYILDSQALARLDNSDHGRTRRKIKRFLREVEDRKIEIKPLDLSSDTAKEQLFKAITEWEKAQTPNNDPDHTEQLALKKTLAHAEVLDIRHLGLYVDDKLSAVILYHSTPDKQYYILNHLKVDYSIPYIFDYMTHHIANKAVQDNVKFLNMEMDLGIENLRQHKMGLKPVEFFRQYTIRPADR